MKSRLPEGYGQSRGDMMKQYQALQQNMAAVQAEHEAAEFEASVSGGLARATVNGKNEVVRIDVKPEIVDPEDCEMMCDLIAAAVNEAIAKAKNDLSQKMSELTGGLGLGGLM